MSNTPNAVDPEAMSLEEMRKLADEEAASLDANVVADDEPAAASNAADDQGDDPAGDEPDEVIYERKIDLGDGSGVQIFRAASLEDLVDKLAKAQENATRKIREQNRL